MTKDIKNEMTKDPEDQTADFPRGTSAGAALDPRPIEEIGPEPESGEPGQPTKAGAAARSQGRTPQEGASEATRPPQREH